MRASILFSAIFAAVAASACVSASAQSDPHAAPAAAQVATPAPYQAYEFLIGDWEGTPNGGEGPAAFVDRFSWGPNRSYIWQSVSLIQPAGEHLHFEGPMVWNAAERRLDFLFAIEPGSMSQERGTVSIATDGSVVREVQLTYGNGTQGIFRHVIRQTGPDTAMASMMRQTETGWAPEFPGSDRLSMRRRPAAAQQGHH